MRYLLTCLFICSIYSLKACFCDTPTVESANFNHYETFFLGKVVKIERLEASVDHKDDVYTYVGTVTTFEILNNWKGEQRKFITIYQESNSCSIPFYIANQRWIISAYKKKFVQLYFINISSRNCISTFVNMVSSKFFDSRPQKSE